MLLHPDRIAGKRVDIMKICIIDGQGGGIGAAVIKRLRELFDERVEIIALGTNAIATAQMLKARANRGASGQNAIVQTVQRVDMVIGPVGIIMANAMMGEVTPRMAEAVASCAAKKFLIPLSQENAEIVGTASIPLPHLIEELIDVNLKPVLDRVEFK
jgi:NAD(P)-dependent dehydrogenase (short-subunit alcohol dehydrogenase family)